MTMDLSCPVPFNDYDRILLAHGGGGRLSQQLVARTILPAFANPHLDPLHDGAIVSVDGVRLAFSTDTYVISPRIFPGGTIGDLAVNGTVNDLAMCGATPLYLSVGFVLEEGLALAEFETIVRSMRVAADAAGVTLVTGDTKVVEKGKGDGVFVNTAGIGRIADGVTIDPRSVRPGDRIILSGDIARHGIAIMSVREGLEFDTTLESDSAPLHGLAAVIWTACPSVRVLRDPTRGGVASALNEIAGSSKAGMIIDERAIPVREEVKSACEILGFDPLYVANEGKLIAIIPQEHAGAVLSAMRAHPAGKDAAIIGEVTSDHPSRVILRTSIGGKRVVDMLSGEQLPRIC